TTLEFEVIVASDGSSDGTREMVGRLAPKLPFSVKWVEQADQGYRKALILNKGVKQSAGDHLIFTDDDCIPPSRFVESHARKAAEAEFVFGHCLTIPQRRHWYFSDKNIVSGKFESTLHIFNRFSLKRQTQQNTRYIQQNHPKMPHLMGGNFAISREKFLQVNGFNHDFEGWGFEDDDLRNRLLKVGVKRTDVGVDGFVFHLGDKHNETPRGSSRAEWELNKAKAYDPNRPPRCLNGFDTL
ncbi:MAG: glycosyltransferase, partial [Chloroflexota bacterium]